MPLLHILGIPVDPRTTAEHLKRTRYDRGLSQLAVARQLGVNVSSVIAWECHDEEPSATSWPALLSFFGFDPYGVSMSIAELLKAIRRRNGEEIPECARRIGVSASRLRCWENGELPGLARTHRLLRFFLRYEIARLRLEIGFELDAALYPATALTESP